MKEVIKQSSAAWSVSLKVIDRQAKKQKRKSLVYEFTGELQAQGITANIRRSLDSAQYLLNEWQTKSKPVQ